jgi:predicted nucleic acid-binding protein
LAKIVVPSTTVAGVAPHPEDDLVLAAAVTAEADFLVTGDKRFLAVGSYAGVTILSPRAFLDVLEAVTS